MSPADQFRQIAASLPEVTEEPHFEKTSFRVNKKIFATMLEGSNIGTVMLTPADQDVFCTFDKQTIYPVPNKWGQGGATHINLALIQVEMLREILKAAYRKVAPKRLGTLVKFV
ncbi:MmcQ/YjbR family DNA-binding protein [Mucilaginibacter sp.]|uniref:MmcQ/YjbR family DNA-binding protein n=1 Tax=Mucilaginibacter sp. TaxID=1882438 RepID=UPI0035BC1C12